ncbi:MAG: phenylacetate--CoA ligase [Candidatus Latescibacterota bacterium]|jgi:phenylacetate-CoA ligase
MRVWNPEYEQMPREAVRQLQAERLRQVVAYAHERLAYYRARMEAAGVHPGQIRGLEDLPRLPFSRKQDFRDNYPTGTFARPLSEVVRIHASSGTTGKPTVVGYTRSDLEIWREVISRLVVAAGVSEGDVVQIAFGYGLFTGGFGLHQGCERVGATVVPASSGNTDRQLLLMQDLGTTALVCTPSYALYLGEIIHDRGLRDRIRLRYGMFGGEPWSEEMRAEIERLLGIKATDNYGLSEIIGPGVSYECLVQQGMHIAEDHFLPEIVDPVTGESLPPGEIGELVLTTLTKEALPVIRYRTGDLTSLIPEPCPCGRTHLRMTRTRGRADDMLIVRGVNVFPSQVESVLAEFEQAKPHYQIVVDRVNNIDTFELLVEASEEIFADQMRVMRGLHDRLASRLQSVLGIKVDLKLVEPRTLQRFEGKAKRVTDNRKL